MQVVSGAMGQEKVHYQAPTPDRVPEEMHRFIDWVNTDTETDGVIKAGIAHLWFVSIHPFDDGNGEYPEQLQICYFPGRRTTANVFTVCHPRSS